VIDMPLNAIPPTTTVAGLQEKVTAARGKCWVDVGFYGGIIPGNSGELKALVREGVRGFKGFLIDSGVKEFPAVSAADISEVMVELADEPTTLMFHAEMIPPITDSVGDDVQVSLPPMSPLGPLNAYSTFLSSRPASFETYAIEEILSMAHLAPNLALHIVHLSAMEAIPLLRNLSSLSLPSSGNNWSRRHQTQMLSPYTYTIQSGLPVARTKGVHRRGRHQDNRLRPLALHT